MKYRRTDMFEESVVMRRVTDYRTNSVDPIGFHENSERLSRSQLEPSTHGLFFKFIFSVKWLGRRSLLPYVDTFPLEMMSE